MVRVKGFELEEQFFWLLQIVVPIACLAGACWGALLVLLPFPLTKCTRLSKLAAISFFDWVLRGFTVPRSLQGKYTRDQGSQQWSKITSFPSHPQNLRHFSWVVTFKETVPWDSTWAAYPLHFLGHWSHHWQQRPPHWLFRFSADPSNLCKFQTYGD